MILLDLEIFEYFEQANRKHKYAPLLNSRIFRAKMRQNPIHRADFSHFWFVQSELADSPKIRHNGAEQRWTSISQLFPRTKRKQQWTRNVQPNTYAHAHTHTDIQSAQLTVEKHQNLTDTRSLFFSLSVWKIIEVWVAKSKEKTCNQRAKSVLDTQIGLRSKIKLDFRHLPRSERDWCQTTWLIHPNMRTSSSIGSNWARRSNRNKMVSWAKAWGSLKKTHSFRSVRQICMQISWQPQTQWLRSHQSRFGQKPWMIPGWTPSYSLNQYIQIFMNCSDGQLFSGAFSAVGALSYGLWSMVQGNQKHSQYAVSKHSLRSKQGGKVAILTLNLIRISFQSRRWERVLGSRALPLLRSLWASWEAAAAAKHQQWNGRKWLTKMLAIMRRTSNFALDF